MHVMPHPCMDWCRIAVHIAKIYGNNSCRLSNYVEKLDKLGCMIQFIVELVA